MMENLQRVDENGILIIIHGGSEKELSDLRVLR